MMKLLVWGVGGDQTRAIASTQGKFQVFRHKNLNFQNLTIKGEPRLFILYINSINHSISLHEDL